MEGTGKLRGTDEPSIADGHAYSRRELLRNGLVLGGGAAAFAITLSGIGTATAEAATGPGGPSVTVAPAKTWPWGAAVDPTMPFYLSPNPGIVGGGGNSSAIGGGGIVAGGGNSSATGGGGIVSAGSGGRTGIAAPLLVIPIAVTVKIGAPAAFAPPFTIQLVATGNALAGDTVTSEISFQRSDQATGTAAAGLIFVKQWLVIVPVILQPGSLQLQATLPASAGASIASTASTGSSITITGDFSQAPLTSTLPPTDQISLVNGIDSQTTASGGLSAPTTNSANVISGFAIGGLFALITNATVSAKAKLLEIHDSKSAISIGDMFEMQMLMNNLNGLSESSTSIISAVNQAITSMARNIKG